MTTPNENDTQGAPTNGPEVTPDVTQQGTGDSSSQQQEAPPLYAEYLERFPESLRPMATEVFKEWDGNVTKMVTGIREEYNPYKPFIEGYEPDAIQQAISIAEALDANPENFVKALVEAYGLDLGVPQQQLQPNQQQQLQQEPVVQYGDQGQPTLEQQRLDQQEQLLRALAERIISDEQARDLQTQQQQEDQVYEQTMAELKTKYGAFDEIYVNSLLAQGADPDAAVQHWRSQVDAFAKQQLQPNLTAPVVMSAGGGTPSVQRNVEDLSTKETRALVEELLRKGAESNT